MKAPAVRDSSPLARLAMVKEDVEAPAEVFRLLTDAEDPKSLEEIAKAWGVPRGRFVEWFSTEHRGRLDAAERVLGIGVLHAVKKMTDDATVENVCLAKFKTDRYLRLAGLLNAERYSPKVEHKHTGAMPTLVIEIAGERSVIEAEPAEVVGVQPARETAELLI
jgi:hypothetical protein